MFGTKRWYIISSLEIGINFILLMMVTGIRSVLGIIISIDRVSVKPKKPEAST